VIAAVALDAPWRRAAVRLGFAITFLVYLQAATGLVPLPITRDPTLLRLAGWPAMAAQVEAARAAAGADFVAADEYGIAAELARQLPAADAVIGADRRWALFNLPPAAPAVAGRTGILVQSARRLTRPDAAPWQSMEDIGTATRGRNGEIAESYRLWRVVGRPITPDLDSGARLPRPH
jgi:hypothetical protein